MTISAGSARVTLADELRHASVRAIAPSRGSKGGPPLHLIPRKRHHSG